MKYRIFREDVYDVDADGKETIAWTDFFIVDSSGRKIRGPFSSMDDAVKELKAIERLQRQAEDADGDPGNSPSFKP